MGREWFYSDTKRYRFFKIREISISKLTSGKRREKDNPNAINK